MALDKKSVPDSAKGSVAAQKILGAPALRRGLPNSPRGAQTDQRANNDRRLARLDPM